MPGQVVMDRNLDGFRESDPALTHDQIEEVAAGASLEIAPAPATNARCIASQGAVGAVAKLADRLRRGLAEFAVTDAPRVGGERSSYG